MNTEVHVYFIFMVRPNIHSNFFLTTHHESKPEKVFYLRLKIAFFLTFFGGKLQEVLPLFTKHLVRGRSFLFNHLSLLPSKGLMRPKETGTCYNTEQSNRNVCAVTEDDLKERK